MLFDNKEGMVADIYRKLLSDQLDVDLGYLYENVVAQMITAANRELYYHTWKKTGSTHSYEIDFLLTSKSKVIPIEVKSASVKKHTSMDQFAIIYSNVVGERYLISQKDVSFKQMLKMKPVYMFPFLLKDL